MTLGFGEALPLAEDGFEAGGLGKGLVGGEGASDEAFGEEIVHLLRADAAAAIEGEVPGDADEPDAEVTDVGESVATLKDADEGVLDGVFGFGAAAEDGVGDAKEEGGVGLGESGEVEFRPGGTRDGKDQAAFLDGGHRTLLSGQTGEGRRRSEIVLRGVSSLAGAMSPGSGRGRRGAEG